MNKDYDPTKLQLVGIDEVKPNDYNPKRKNTKEYQNVVKSIALNGLKQPIFVREVGKDLVIVDGEQRWTAAKELGYAEIYVYNLGDISEEEAKALTIWFEVQVPFDEVLLAPIAVELEGVNMELPFTKEELDSFKELVSFDLDGFEDKPPVEESEDSYKTFVVQLTAKQFKAVNDAIKTLSTAENVSEGRALELLVADGLSGYEQNNTENC